MEFGPWLHKIRTERQLDVRTMSELTGVDGSTISRIENGRTQSTLNTAIRICEGLRISFHQLVSALMDKQSSADIILPGSDIPRTTVGMDDTTAFLDLMKRNPDAGVNLLTGLLNTTLARQAHIEEDPFPLLFVPENIPQLLLKSPTYQFELCYPPDVYAGMILGIYADGGVLTRVDVGVYIRESRQNLEVTQADFEKTIRRSASVLSRLETGALDRIKLVDVLALDEHLGDQNEILGMYWNAFTVQIRFNGDLALGDWTVMESDVANLLITTCRWLQLQYEDDTSWLSDLRHELGTAHPD